jgi:hypothetical protein
MNELDHRMELTGTGDTKEQAFNQVFGRIKSLVARTFPDKLIVQIEPRDIEIITATETAYTERFFGLLFPRERIRYDIKAAVTVRLRFFDLAEVAFEQRRDTVSPIRRVLEWR